MFTLIDLEVFKKVAFFKELSNYKTEMMASISHEFKTPLNSILNLIECAN